MRESLLLDVAGDDEFQSIMMADPQTGLTSAEAQQRLKEFGINVITEPVSEIACSPRISVRMRGSNVRPHVWMRACTRSPNIRCSDSSPTSPGPCQS